MEMEIGTHNTKTFLIWRHIFKDRILNGEIMKDDHSHWNHAVMRSRGDNPDNSSNIVLPKDD